EDNSESEDEQSIGFIKEDFNGSGVEKEGDNNVSMVPDSVKEDVNVQAEENEKKMDKSNGTVSIPFPPGFTPYDEIEVECYKKSKETKMEDISLIDVKCCWGNYAFEYVYSPAVEYAEKKMLWDYLVHVISKWDGEVIVLGVFNEVQFKNERFGSLFHAHGADAFNRFILQANLQEIPLGGCSFTWYLSDHRPIMLRDSSHDYGPILFRMYHYWFGIDGLEEMISKAWCECLIVEVNPMLYLMYKMKFLKKCIREWNGKRQSNKCKKKAFKKDLHDLEIVIDQGNATDDILYKRMEIIKDIPEAEKVDNLEAAQIAKIKWAIEGDENTKDSLWVRVIHAIHGVDGMIGRAGNVGYTSIWCDIIKEMDRGGATIERGFPRIYALEWDHLLDSLEGVMLNPSKDRWSWDLNGSGEFSVASARRYIDNNRLPDISSNIRWIKEVPIKVNVHAWKEGVPERLLEPSDHRSLDKVLGCGRALPHISLIWNHPAFYNNDEHDDEEFSIPMSEIYKSSLTVITPDLLITDSLIMEDEHLDTILKTESDKLIKSSVENLVPNPSEFEGLSEDLSDIESECDVPVGDDFTTFSNLLFDVDDNFSPSDDESFSDEDVPKEIYSNPLFDEEIISIKTDPHHFNVGSDLIESFLNQEFLGNDSHSLPENESFHFDVPSSPRPPAKPPDDGIYFDDEPVTGILTVKVVDDIFKHYVLMPRLLPTQPTLCLMIDTLRTKSISYLIVALKLSSFFLKAR
nr:hypothetical protein [Tanacetum cinerariifolium]